MSEHGLPLSHWPLAGHEDLRDLLYAAYRGRDGYHDDRHLAEVLARIDELGAGGDVEVVLAAWFHDAVYDADGDLEERSARLAERELRPLAASAGVDVAEVARLVRLTAGHDPAPDDRRGAVLCDADLAILAAPADRYAAYTADVRREYAHVPDHDFAAGRLALLREFLARPRLFRTDHARRHWEDGARANLRAEVEELSRQVATDGP